MKEYYEEYGIVPCGRMSLTGMKRFLERILAEDATISLWDAIDKKKYELVKVENDKVRAILRNFDKKDVKCMDDLFPNLSIGDLASKWGYISFYKEFKITHRPR